VVHEADSSWQCDFGIVREDAVPKDIKRWKLREVGCALFAANAFWKNRSSVEEFVQNVPIVELLPGGQFTERWHAWPAKERLVPKVFVRVSSFIELGKIVQAGHAASVLPDLAEVDFDPKRYAHRSIPALRNRTLVLIANSRSLGWSGVGLGVAPKLAELLKLD